MEYITDYIYWLTCKEIIRMVEYLWKYNRLSVFHCTSYYSVGMLRELVTLQLRLCFEFFPTIPTLVSIPGTNQQEQHQPHSWHHLGSTLKRLRVYLHMFQWLKSLKSHHTMLTSSSYLNLSLVVYFSKTGQISEV